MSLAERDRVGIEQVSALHHNARVASVCAFSAQVIFTAIMLRLRVIDEGRAAVWFVLGAAAIAGQLALGRRWSPSQVWRRSAWWFTGYTLLEGLLWGCAFLFILPDNVGIRMLYVSMLLGIAAGAVVAFGSFLPACLAFLATATLPCFIWMLLQGNTFYDGAALLLVLLDLTLVIMARDNDARFLAAVGLRFANETLAENLRIQRDAAEQANAAKSRFLAAASHDLRQPVHALSMLTEAFSISDMSEPNRRVVALIGQSVAALDKLFDALLYISRLDAGLVSVRRQPVAIGPLLERLADEFRLICKAKGLRLVLLPCCLIVDTDPVLLERILRNFIETASATLIAGVS